MSYKSHHHSLDEPNLFLYSLFTHDYDYVLGSQKRQPRVEVVEYGRAPTSSNFNHQASSDKNVDAIAEKFIKREHQKFELSKFASMRADTF